MSITDLEAKYTVEDLELEYDGSQDIFSEIDDNTDSKLSKHDPNTAATEDETRSELYRASDMIKQGDHGVPNDYDQARSNNPGHIFQEMALVKSRIDFDEQAFREQCHLKSVELSQKFKGQRKLYFKSLLFLEAVGELYDLVDSFVAELSKSLHQMQVDQYAEYETKLAGIRRKAVEAETIDQSIQKFLSIMQQAFKQSFSAPEDADCKQADAN